MGLFPAAQLPGELPGEDLIRAGLEDLRRGDVTVEALLVSVGAPRLRLLGLEIPETPEAPEDALFALLERDDPGGAHSRYNVLIRRLVSFENAAECLLPFRTWLSTRSGETRFMSSPPVCPAR